MSPADLGDDVLGGDLVAADGLPPKWFDKNPATSFGQDLTDITAAIQEAIDFTVGSPAASVFDSWRRTYDHLQHWGQERSLPTLVSTFAASMVERAMIDAFCRAEHLTFGAAVAGDHLGVHLGSIHPELTGYRPTELLPPASTTLAIRHTVGLSDPLEAKDIPIADIVADGLPQTLADNIEYYGITRLKIKVSGQVQHDLDRLDRAVTPGRATDRDIIPLHARR